MEALVDILRVLFGALKLVFEIVDFVFGLRMSTQGQTRASFHHWRRSLCSSLGIVFGLIPIALRRGDGWSWAMGIAIGIAFVALGRLWERGRGI